MKNIINTANYMIDRLTYLHIPSPASAIGVACADARIYPEAFRRVRSWECGRSWDGWQFAARRDRGGFTLWRVGVSRRFRGNRIPREKRAAKENRGQDNKI